MGKGNGAVAWYRTGSPAFYNGCDWAALTGDPPDLNFIAGLKRGGLQVPDFAQYKVVVFQQPAGPEWQREIFRLRDLGVKVLYEIDDHIHSVRKIPGHAAAEAYTKKRVAQHESCMRACDGLIVSTEFLARAYKKFNPNVWVCRNAIEGSRYEPFTKPERDKVHLGWAGGEGHQKSITSWLPAVQQTLDKHDVRFISVGLQAAEEVNAPGRTMGIHFVPIECVPGVLCNFDIGIAPAGRNDFFRAKSDLRFLELGALGIPCVGDPFVYDTIEDGVTGFLARDSDEAATAIEELVEDATLREEVGQNAREYVLSERTIEKQAAQWVDVFMEITSD